MSNNFSGITNPIIAPLARYDRLYADRIVFIGDLIVEIDERRVVPTRSPDPLFKFMHTPNKGSWSAASLYVDDQFPEWRQKMQGAEKKDQKAGDILTAAASKLKQLARKEVDVDSYGSIFVVDPSGLIKTCEKHTYTVPGLISREGFISMFLFNRHKGNGHKGGPQGSSPHFYELDTKKNQLCEWKGKITKRLYVVMSRGYFEVPEDWIAVKNNSSEGRLIFSHDQGETYHLKGQKGHLTELRSPTSEFALFKHDDKEMKGRFTNLTQAINNIWSPKTDGDIDCKWMFRGLGDSGDPKWPKDWSNKSNWNHLDICRQYEHLPPSLGEQVASSSSPVSVGTEVDPQIARPPTAPASRSQTPTSGARNLVSPGETTLHLARNSTSSITSIQIGGGINPSSPPLNPQRTTTDAPSSTPTGLGSPAIRTGIVAKSAHIPPDVRSDGAHPTRPTEVIEVKSRASNPQNQPQTPNRKVEMAIGPTTRTSLHTVPSGASAASTEGPESSAKTDFVPRRPSKKSKWKFWG
ncbi:SubName: Full=Uncharacterized protein {ECO:0000313/EMBL:CCA67092.1} [Serendipita indica DSM 11827]|nr:SubName: Full=Uncharacterized protein {ECO:0000313/EMBL:CCA67092.1} [Serendipita indica DSM 11827]